MRHNPIYASTLGDKRYNDQIDDFSQETIDADLEHERLYLSRIEAIDTTGFPDQEILNERLMVRDLRMESRPLPLQALGDAAKWCRDGRIRPSRSSVVRIQFLNIRQPAARFQPYID